MNENVIGNFQAVQNKKTMKVSIIFYLKNFSFSKCEQQQQQQLNVNTQTIDQ